MKAKRDDINLDRVIQNLLKGHSYSEVAEIESRYLDGRSVGRGLIAGVHRDIKIGTLKPFNTNNRFGVKTYTYGVEPDNGGLPLYVGHPYVEGNHIVISDIHIPKTDYKLVESVNSAGKFYGVKELIIAGDLYDMGSQANFRKKVKASPTSSDFAISRDMLSFFLEWFNSVKFIPGNHDDWFLENQDGNLQISDLARLSVHPIDTNYVVFYAYDRMTLNNGGQDWTIAHQSESSTMSLKVAEQLANKYHTNVIVPHQHNTAFGFDRYNWYVLVDIGGLHNKHLMEYVSLKTSVAPTYDNGYVVIQDGAFELIVPDERNMAWRRLGIND